MTSLEWPAGFDRTPTADREPNRNFEVSLAQAFDDLEGELERVGVDDFRYSFDAEQRKTDGRPYSRASPDDPGFVLRWTMDGQQYAVGCDAFSRLRDNVRTAGLYIREKRKMESRPVATGESEFANARLPPGDDDAIVVSESGTKPPHEVLGVAPDAPEPVVRGAFRELLKVRHPDHGGSQAEFRELQRAKEVMLDA